MAAELVSVAPERLGRRLVRWPSRWALLVLASAATLLCGAAVLGVWWLASSKTKAAAYNVPRNLLGIELRVQSGDVTVVGAGRTGRVSVSRSDHSVYGHGPREQRSLQKGILHIASSCPQFVLGSCASNYRIDVPNNVPISVRAESGAVRIEGYRGSADIATNRGAISVEGYCGFVLGAASASGDISVSASCSPERLALRSDSGDVTVTVPPGNYRLDASSNSGNANVRGLVNDTGAPWDIEALSNSGNVTVSAGA